MRTTNKTFIVDSNASFKQLFDRFTGSCADDGIVEVITSATVLDTTKVYNFFANSLEGIFPLMEVEKEISYKGRIHYELLGGDVR